MLINRLAIRDYWDLGKEGAKDDKFVVLVSERHIILQLCLMTM